MAHTAVVKLILGINSKLQQTGEKHRTIVSFIFCSEERPTFEALYVKQKKDTCSYVLSFAFEGLVST